MQPSFQSTHESVSRDEPKINGFPVLGRTTPSRGFLEGDVDWLGDRPSGVWDVNEGRLRWSGWLPRAVRSVGVCFSSQNGNVRVRSWQLLSIFIVYCLPTPRTVNNGTPSLWARCGRDWSWSSRSGQSFLQLSAVTAPIRHSFHNRFESLVTLLHCTFHLIIFTF